jgi:ribosomal protein L7/L12
VSTESELALSRRIASLEQRLAAIERGLGVDPPADASADSAGGGLGFGSDPSYGQASPTVVELIAAGKQIEAIKAYREETGCGLAEAKETVERIARGP